MMVSQEAIARLRQSGAFDAQWYLAQYPDVAASGMDPAEHYLWLGEKLGRPGTSAPALFDEVASLSTSAAIDDEGPSWTQGDTLAPEVRQLIEKSGLFDSQHYIDTYGHDMLVPDDPLADYINAYRVGRNRDPNPLFSTEYYLATHPDVTDMHPFIHYVQYGQSEGRAAFSPEKVNDYLAASVSQVLPSLQDMLPMERAINILYWKDGNFFLTDVAHYIKSLLIELGYKVSIHTQTPPDDGKGALNLVVAPHEFCACGPGLTWTEDQYRAAAYVSTEQWHTSWFALSLRYLQRTEVGILDLNPSSAAGLTRMGMPSAFVPLLPVPGSCFDIPVEPLNEAFTRLKFIRPLTYPTDMLKRPYDITMVAILNERRAKALAGLAPTLAPYTTFLHCPRSLRPMKVGDPDLLSVRNFTQIARNSKIMLNIHQGGSHYLEWQRMFLIGIMEGCVVVSEPCTPNHVVQPGEHYVECEIPHMATTLRFLLDTADGQALMKKINANNMKIRADIAAGKRFF